MTLAAFASFRKIESGLPAALAAAVLVLVVLPWVPPAYLRASAGTLMAAMMFHGFLCAGLPVFTALAITVLSLAQAGLFLSAAGRAGSIWLALAVYCVAAAAAGFVRRRDPRRVMLLGGALSLAQLLDPMGAMLAAFLLPVCVGLPRRGEGRNKFGLLALLLFVPAVTALVLSYARGVLGLDPMRFALTGLGPRAIAHTPFVLLVAAAFASAPVLWLTVFVKPLRRPASLMTVNTALAVLAAVGVASLLGAERDMTLIMAAMAAASAAALGSWRRVARHANLALAASALAALLSWLLFYLPSLQVT